MEDSSTSPLLGNLTIAGLILLTFFFWAYPFYIICKRLKTVNENTIVIIFAKNFETGECFEVGKIKRKYADKVAKGLEKQGFDCEIMEDFD